MEQPSPQLEPPSFRAVENVDVLKALADPTRLDILAALMKGGSELPVMSVKELAAELGQPQTKLYRHVRQLEAVGLIKVASTRMVSGILEQRYQACQQDLMFGRGMLQEQHPDEAEVVMQTVLDRYRDGLFAAFRADRLSADDVPAGESYRTPLAYMSDFRVSPAKAAELKRKLEEVTDSLKEEDRDPDGVTVNLLIGFYVPVDPPS